MKNLKIRYQKDIAPKLAKDLGIANIMAVPKINKIILNIGVPKAESSKKDIETYSVELANITGQKPKLAKAKQSIAGFNIRQGDPVGLSVTLRGQKMFDFLDKLCRIVLPQVKDFRGLKNSSFDQSGNYTLGLTEQIIFPEIDYAKVDKVHGMEITIVTSVNNKNHAKTLLEYIGIPFEKLEAN